MRDRLTRNHYRIKVYRYIDTTGAARASFTLFVNGENATDEDNLDLPGDLLEDLVLDLGLTPTCADAKEYDSTPITASQRAAATAILQGEALMHLSDLLVDARNASRTLMGLLRTYPLPEEQVDRMHGRWSWLRPLDDPGP